ncbi:MAG TPA: hypothetical protein VFR58_17045 [Flavisolibacter sp.]|nr:hypothetical protein [Flavisolibacter sp.]
MENYSQPNRQQIKETIQALEDTYADFLGRGIEPKVLNNIFIRIRELKAELEKTDESKADSQDLFSRIESPGLAAAARWR